MEYVWKNPECEELFNKLINHDETYSIFTITDKVQTLRIVSWKDVWDIIRSEHWHTSGKASCPHSESLYEHLCHCAEICYEKSKTDKHVHFYAGLLHDIGKPGALMIRGKRTAFKGHGLIGGSLLQHLWSYTLGSAIGVTYKQWSDISTTTDVHMCGYFPDMCLPIQLDTFGLLTSPVRQILKVLRQGDLLALQPQADEKSKRDEEIEKMIETQEAFETAMDTVPQDYFAKYNLNNGVLIQLQGASGSGKTFFRKYIKNYLVGCTVIEVVRDDVMVATVLKDQGKPVVTDYSSTLYKECYDYYQEKKPILSKRVNLDMMEQIQEALLQGFVVITDTLATAFLKPAQAILPKKELMNTFKVSFWTSRGPELFTEENSLARHGMTVEKQIDVHGKRQLMNPLMNLEDYGSIISLMEHKLWNMNQDYVRPHISLSTNWNGLKHKEIRNLLDHVKSAYKYNQSLVRKLVYGTSFHYDLRELLEQLFLAGGLEEVKDFFNRYSYHVSVVDEQTVGIKYIDGKNNLWRAKWAREARGRFYHFDGKKVIVLKDALQRGAEILTRSHKEVEETQDMTSKRFDHLDDTQQEIISLLGKNEDVKINGLLSFKVDGMLLVLNFYPKNCEQYPIMKNLIGDEREAGKKLFLYLEDETLVVPSTQGTLFAGENIWGYMLTAFCGERGLEVPDTTPLKAWKQLDSEMRKWFTEMYDSIMLKDEMINLTMEMVCKNRTTYRGNVHMELAVSYDSSFVSFLGLFYKGKYIPHVYFEHVGWYTQPACIEIKSTKMLHDIISDLEDVIVRGKSGEEFSLKWFKLPHEIHAEGFVFLYSIGGYNLPTLTCDEYDYSKIKLESYYMLHKIRRENIPRLLALPSSADKYFPSLVALRKFTSDLQNMLSSLAWKLHLAVKEMLASGCSWAETLNERAKLRMQKYVEGSTDDEDIKVVYAICTRNGIDSLRGVFNKTAGEIFGIDVQDKSELTGLCVDLVAKTKPWQGEEKIQEVVKVLIEKRDAIVGKSWNLLVATPP